MEVSGAAVRDVLLPLVTEHKLANTPGGMCEDGTSSNHKLDWELTPEGAAEGAAAEDAAAEDGAENEQTRRAIVAREDARMVQEGGETAATAAAVEEAQRWQALDTQARDEALERLKQTPSSIWRRGLRVWGFMGGPVTVHGHDKLLELFTSKTRVIARYVYIPTRSLYRRAALYKRLYRKLMYIAV